MHYYQTLKYDACIVERPVKQRLLAYRNGLRDRLIGEDLCIKIYPNKSFSWIKTILVSKSCSVIIIGTLNVPLFSKFHWNLYCLRRSKPVGYKNQMAEQMPSKLHHGFPEQAMNTQSFILNVAPVSLILQYFTRSVLAIVKHKSVSPTFCFILFHILFRYFRKVTNSESPKDD